RCSRSRIAANCPGRTPGSWLPLSPLVSNTYVISLPCSANFAIVPPQPNSGSSGCAAITMTRSKLSCCSVMKALSLLCGDLPRAVTSSYSILLAPEIRHCFEPGNRHRCFDHISHLASIAESDKAGQSRQTLMAEGGPPDT